MSPAMVSDERRLGLTIGLEGLPLQEQIRLAREGEGWGYTDAWSAETAGPDGFSPLAALAATTEQMRLGTAIVPIFTRPPALAAMSAAALHDLSGGRFVLGLGTSSDIIINRWMGGSFERPITRLREYVEAVRAILAGKKSDLSGETLTSHGFRLQLPLAEPPPIYIAALGPKACRMAGEIADGVIFFLKGPEGVATAMEQVREGARAAGRDPDAIDAVIRVMVAVGEDEQVLTYMARRLTASYAMVDVYNRSLRNEGFEAESDAIRELWSAGDRNGAVERVSDRMLDRLHVFGDLDHCLARIEEFRAAGITTPVIAPISVAGDPAERATRIVDATRSLATG
jgi:probable F420-dependent oxidoreductase